MSSNVRVEKLASGPTALLREVHVSPVAEVQIYARVGSADERPGEAGLAHFHEHMLFKGTETRGVGEIAGTVEGAGGRINAFTSFDLTCYHATLPSDATFDGLDVLADAVQNSIFDPDEVAREIDVVLEEIRRSEDDPHHVLSDLAFETVYRQHPYRAPILGTKESVSALTREKLRAFYQHWYDPANLVVVAVGDFDSEALLARMNTVFTRASHGAPPHERVAEPRQSEPRIAVARRPFERACLDISWRTVPFSHPDAAYLDLLAFVLGEGESSRLVLRVKDELGLADRIDASSYTPLDAGVLGVTVDLDPEQTLDAVAAVVHETEMLREEVVSDEELEKARANFLATQAWERESVAGMARKLASFHLVAGDHREEEAYLERIRRATPDDLKRVAREWLDPQRVCVTGVVDEAADASLTDGAVGEAAALGAREAARLFHAPRSRQQGAADPIRSYELEGGIQLHVAPRRDVPVVAIRAALLGGQLYETAETAGLSSFTAGMWMRGTRARSSADFARRVESLAADIDCFSGRNTCGLSLDATHDRLAPVLDLFAEAVLSPAFASEEIERERRETLASLKRREDRLGALAFDLFSHEHYREHPYRWPLLGTHDCVERFDREALVAHHERLMRPDNLALAVAGDVDPDEVAAQIARRLCMLGQAEAAPPLPPVEPAPSEAREACLEKERAQAHLVMGFRGLTIADPDRIALEVLAQTLAGQGGRLFLELRDRQGLAYTVSAVNVEGLAPGFFAVYIATAPDKLGAARRGMREELERIVQEAPDAGELERAQRYLVGNFAIDEQRSGTRALHMALDARYELGADASRHYPERVRAVTRDDLLRVAQRLIDFDTCTVALVGPPGVSGQ